jgi:hypothetical protein
MSGAFSDGPPLLRLALGKGKAARTEFALQSYDKIVQELKALPSDISLKYQAAALKKAAKPGQDALRSQVSRIRQVTGNLLASVTQVVKKYNNSRAKTPVGVVVIGFRRPANQNSQKGATPAFIGGTVLKGPNRAYHSHLIEFGTKPRVPGFRTRGRRRGRAVLGGRIQTLYEQTREQTANQSGILSSFRTRGAFRGRGIYPTDFIATGRVAGTPAQRPLAKAFAASKTQMQSILDTELRRALTLASRAYAKRLEAGK